MNKNIAVIFTIIVTGIIFPACSDAYKGGLKTSKMSEIDHKVDSVLSLMTIEEKIGQMSQLAGVGELTGPIAGNGKHKYIDAVKNGNVGSMLNINGVEYTRRLQEITLTETRLGIPLLFGYDVIHGYKTIFPIPLAEACSWDLKVIEKSARVAAIEASAAGQHWTFAPMVDIARDPRWGRIAEGAGEDTYLGCLIAKARVKGFQGDDLADPSTIAACTKHYAAYGAAEGGRDYNTTDMSYRTLAELYLPPFKATVDARAATFMFAFNELNGVPASSNEMLGKILRNEWNFNGLVVSDWNSLGELIPHGIAADKKDAAFLGMKATIDMDMQGNVYSECLVDLVKQGKISENQIDEAVRHILKLKFQLGLFDDPYRYCDENREKQLLLCPEHRQIARETAKKSIVLLKNENNLLPLKTDIKSIAVIGPLADNSKDILGCWKGRGDTLDAVGLLKGIRNRNLEKTKIYYSKGCNIVGENKSGFSEAVRIAKKADIVILAMGESANMSGEARSRSFLGLPGIQLDLIKEIQKTGKPVILVLMNGRPLAIPWESENLDCILEAWFGGTEAGNAIADVLFGDYNPSGKLVASFPYTTGQVPVYYNHKNTGRPARPSEGYSSKYIDAPIESLFPFGFGLSYTNFDYSGVTLSKTEMDHSDTSIVSVTVKNSGQYDGEEVVQLYIQDLKGSVTRPISELKGFEKIQLKVGEEKQVNFYITKGLLSFYDIDMNFIAEPGDFKIMVGTNSAKYQETKLTLRN
jgi:beta-glucosidase